MFDLPAGSPDGEECAGCVVTTDLACPSRAICGAVLTTVPRGIMLGIGVARAFKVGGTILFALCTEVGLVAGGVGGCFVHPPPLPLPLLFTNNCESITLVGQ